MVKETKTDICSLRDTFAFCLHRWKNGIDKRLCRTCRRLRADGAQLLHNPERRVRHFSREIVHQRRGITPDTALRLARYFHTTPGFWLNLQSSYDLEVAQDKLSRTIERDVRPSTFAAANAAS
jgi:plasmid maintenance system antidote protein VapI